MKFTISIENALPSDANEISNLVLENATFYLKQHYTDAQWLVFLSYYSVEALLHKIQNQDVFCAKVEGKIVGTIALDKDYIVGFYTHIQFANKGIGSTLLQHIEEFARVDKGYSEILLASSPVGVTFYTKYGWQIIEKVILDYLGVDFEETIMKKWLQSVS